MSMGDPPDVMVVEEVAVWGKAMLTHTRNTSATQSAPADAPDTATQVSDITNRGSQNGRGFGRGAYGNTNA